MQSSKWCFTEQDVPRDFETWGESLITSDIGVVGIIYQLEKGGETLKDHLQGVLKLRRTRRLAWLKSHVSGSAHWEPCRNLTASVTYCSKEESRISGPYEFGTLGSQQGKRTDLETAVTCMLQDGMATAIETYPVTYVKYYRGLHTLENFHKKRRTQKPFVAWYHGETGSGKTRRAVQDISNENLYMKMNNKWWDGYTQQQRIVIDDYTIETNGLGMGDLLRILDRYAMIVEVKGGTVQLNSPEIYITSNQSIEALFFQHPQLAALMRRIDQYEEINL